jgi:hypothetical protein
VKLRDFIRDKKTSFDDK